MAKSNSESQAEFRAEKLANGEKELRGLYVKVELHKTVKDYVKKYLRRIGNKNE